jgi:hypothetical protein
MIDPRRHAANPSAFPGHAREGGHPRLSVALTATPPNIVSDAAMLKPDGDTKIEILHTALDVAFEWSLDRFSQTYRDLA